MLTFTTGNLFKSPAHALVNTVNTVGVMGKGIALEFKKAFPYNFKEYEKACKLRQVTVGKMFVTYDYNPILGEKMIINFPTKTHWKEPSTYDIIDKGLDDLVILIIYHEIESLAMPALGCGNGGLEWIKVKSMIKHFLQYMKVDITVYEPTRNL